MATLSSLIASSILEILSWHLLPQFCFPWTTAFFPFLFYFLSCWRVSPMCGDPWVRVLWNWVTDWKRYGKGQDLWLTGLTDGCIVKPVFSQGTLKCQDRQPYFWRPYTFFNCCSSKFLLSGSPSVITYFHLSFLGSVKLATSLFHFQKTCWHCSSVIVSLLFFFLTCGFIPFLLFCCHLREVSCGRW